METDRERYGTFPIFGETKNEYGAPAPAGKANARFLEKQKQNKCNVAILHGSKQIGGRRGAETLQYRILSDLQLLPSARTKASVRFSTERKTNGALLQRCKSRRVVRGIRRGAILLLLRQRRLFLCQAWKQGSTGRLEGMEEAYVDCYFLLGLFAV